MIGKSNSGNGESKYSLAYSVSRWNEVADLAYDDSTTRLAYRNIGNEDFDSGGYLQYNWEFIGVGTGRKNIVTNSRIIAKEDLLVAIKHEYGDYYDSTPDDGWRLQVSSNGVEYFDSNTDDKYSYKSYTIVLKKGESIDFKITLGINNKIFGISEHRAYQGYIYIGFFGRFKKLDELKEGKYTGIGVSYTDATKHQFIDIGYTPTKVEVTCPSHLNESQYNGVAYAELNSGILKRVFNSLTTLASGSGSYNYAYNKVDEEFISNYNLSSNIKIAIAEGGFYVFGYSGSSARTNVSGVEYLWKAWK